MNANIAISFLNCDINDQLHNDNTRYEFLLKFPDNRIMVTCMTPVLLWSPYVIGQTIIFLPCDFFLSSSFFPRLISAVRDWMSTILLHMAWP